MSNRVKKIQELLDQGYSQSEISRMLGVSRQRIGQIIQDPKNNIFIRCFSMLNCGNPAENFNVCLCLQCQETLYEDYSTVLDKSEIENKYNREWRTIIKIASKIHNSRFETSSNSPTDPPPFDLLRTHINKQNKSYALAAIRRYDHEECYDLWKNHDQSLYSLAKRYGITYSAVFNKMKRMEKEASHEQNTSF